MSIPPRNLRSFVAILIASSCTALAAQSLRCRTRVENFAFVRVEGLAEIVGDLVIECTGGTPTPAGQQLPSVDFEVELNTEVSSRILEGNRLEALIFIDDPAPAAQVFGKTVFQGQQVEGNRIRWTGVLFDPPGPDRQRILRFKNIRADASAFESEPRGEAGIILRLDATGVLEAPLGDVLEKVAFTQRGLSFSVGDAQGGAASAAARLLRSHDNNKALLADPTADFSSPGGRSFTLRFEEKIEAAFHRRVLSDVLGHIQDQAEPASPSFTETGFFNPALPAQGGLDRAGLADHGTRLMASFRGVPAGVAIFVTVSPVRPGSTRIVDADLVSTNPDGTNTGGETVKIQPASIADRGLAPVPIVNGEGQAVWEITSADFDAIDTVSFGVTVAYLRDAPELATVFVSGSFAPLSSENSSSVKAPLPRFTRDRSFARAFEIVLGDACGVSIQDVVLGGLDDPLKDDIFAFDALAGTLLDLEVNAKAGAGPVEIRFFDPSIDAIDIGPFVKARGRSTKLKAFPLFDSGEYQVVLRSADGSPAEYRLKVRGKLPKERLKLKLIREVSNAAETLFEAIEAVAGSVLKATLKGKGTDPDILELVEPSQGAILPLGPFLTQGLKTEKLKGLVLPVTGVYRLAFTGRGTPGSLNLSIRIKAPGRRVLEECLE